MTDEKLDFIPYKDISELKNELDDIQNKKDVSNKELHESVQKLSKVMGDMLEVFGAAAEQMKLEEREHQAEARKQDNIGYKIEKLIDQNKIIAEGIVAVVDLVKEKLGNADLEEEVAIEHPSTDKDVTLNAKKMAIKSPVEEPKPKDFSPVQEPFMPSFSAMQQPGQAPVTPGFPSMPPLKDKSTAKGFPSMPPGPSYFNSGQNNMPSPPMPNPSFMSQPQTKVKSGEFPESPDPIDDLDFPDEPFPLEEDKPKKKSLFGMFKK
jgi:hypothetical protein